VTIRVSCPKPLILMKDRKRTGWISFIMELCVSPLHTYASFWTSAPLMRTL
jgi:hypothetical protein